MNIKFFIYYYTAEKSWKFTKQFPQIFSENIVLFCPAGGDKRISIIHLTKKSTSYAKANANAFNSYVLKGEHQVSKNTSDEFLTLYLLSDLRVG